jgi:hypothetical protein
MAKRWQTKGVAALLHQKENARDKRAFSSANLMQQGN